MTPKNWAGPGGGDAEARKHFQNHTPLPTAAAPKVQAPIAGNPPENGDVP
jgi:hypothetical protein